MQGADISTHQERIAVVTGANRGIGFEICRQLVKKRVKVVLTARDDVKGRETCEKLKDGGGEAVFHPLDVTDRQEIIPSEPTI